VSRLVGESIDRWSNETCEPHTSSLRNDVRNDSIRNENTPRLTAALMWRSASFVRPSAVSSNLPHANKIGPCAGFGRTSRNGAEREKRVGCDGTTSCRSRPTTSHSNNCLFQFKSSSPLMRSMATALSLCTHSHALALALAHTRDPSRLSVLEHIAVERRIIVRRQLTHRLHDQDHANKSNLCGIELALIVEQCVVDRVLAKVEFLRVWAARKPGACYRRRGTAACQVPRAGSCIGT